MRASRLTKVDLESSMTMLAKGPHALHGYVTNTMEATIGRELPQMEVRYSNLSIIADVAVIGDVSAKSELQRSQTTQPGQTGTEQASGEETHP
ncbi:hypothetical protein DVH05_024451 [Phytophthora capsici]|nr:hypothetical protein DVH05_024451 [Phytophthora capsici]|eukprot:jgi/Phyca11/99084/e_gw1.3.508.1